MSHDTIEIRHATSSDPAILADHRVAMFRDMGSAQPSIELTLRDAAAAEIRDAMEHGEYVAWLAHVAGEPERIVGGAAVQLRRLLPRPDVDGACVLIGREGLVLNMYVEPDFRRRGVARRLMEAILAWAPKANVVRLVLHASDEGRPLYESLGFEATNEMRYTRPLRA
jgi:GNAT superfamily N-acetyltransferase